VNTIEQKKCAGMLPIFRPTDPTAVPYAECLAADRLPRGTRHARAAECKRDFHIPLNSLAAREFMVAEVQKLAAVACAVPSANKGCDQAIAPTFSRSGDRRSLRRAACGVQHIALNARAARAFMVAEVQKQPITRNAVPRLPDPTTAAAFITHHSSFIIFPQP